MLLLSPQGVRGIEHGASEGMHADGKQGGRHDGQTGRDEGDGIDLGAIGEVRQPRVHEPPGRRPGQDVANHHEDDELSRQQGESRRVAEDACQILLILIEPGDIVLQVGELEGGFGHGFSPRVP